MPLWFRRRLEWVDKDLTLQFIPPRDEKTPKGANPEIYPMGIWVICKRLRKTGLLSPRVVWSLADIHGLPAKPTPKTFRLIQQAYRMQRRKQMDKMEEMMEEGLIEMNRAREERSVERLRSAIKKHCSAQFGRQWLNRVYIREGVTNEVSA
jgi:hypothetical protein